MLTHSYRLEIRQQVAQPSHKCSGVMMLRHTSAAARCCRSLYKALMLQGQFLKTIGVKPSFGVRVRLQTEVQAGMSV